MILAAGYGRRLRPLTDRIPKALVEVGGVPMLERIARRLIEAGADRLIVNIHHHAEQIHRFIADRDGFGVEVRISEEQGAPLETGGGLLHAAPHFRRDRPFLLHNVDIITDVDLRAMIAAHEAADPLATMAVSGRETSRLLRFDDRGLQAKLDLRSGTVQAARPQEGSARDRAFGGIHVVSPRIFELMTETGAFSILVPYLRLSAAGHRIAPFEMGGGLWLEIGDPDRLRRARETVAEREGEGGVDR